RRWGWRRCGSLGRRRRRRRWGWRRYRRAEHEVEAQAEHDVVRVVWDKGGILNETAAVLHFGAKLKSRRPRLFAEGRQRTDSALCNPAVIPLAADGVLHQAAAREQVGPNRGGRGQKFV